jgi:hypothetical protein
VLGVSAAAAWQLDMGYIGGRCALPGVVEQRVEIGKAKPAANEGGEKEECLKPAHQDPRHGAGLAPLRRWRQNRLHSHSENATENIG